MTLSIMESKDAFKTALRDFKGGVGDIPKVLERYLGYVARTGKPLFAWDMIVILIIKKFEIVCEGYGLDDSEPKIRVPVEDKLIDDLKNECLKVLNGLVGVPFTIQRLCELLLTSRQNYSRLDKFLRGFLRVIKVVTTVNRFGQRITTESQSFANALSPFQMNEMGDNWPGFSEESSSLIQDNSPTTDSISSSDNKGDMDYEDKSTDDALHIDTEPLSSYCNNKQQQSIQQNIYSNDTFFIEQKTISMPPIGALFKSIDQLEVFVQNVSSQVESSIESQDVIKKRTSNNLMLPENDDLSDVSSAKRQKIVESASSSNVDTISNLDSMDCVESLPSRSSELIICAEEASSTNDINDHSLLHSDVRNVECSDNVINNEIVTSQDALSKQLESLEDVIFASDNVVDSEFNINNDSALESDSVSNSTASIIEGTLKEIVLESKDIVDCSVNIVKLDLLSNLDTTDDEDIVDSGIIDNFEEVAPDSGPNDGVEGIDANVQNSNEYAEIETLKNDEETINEFRDIHCLEKDESVNASANSCVEEYIASFEVTNSVVELYGESDVVDEHIRLSAELQNKEQSTEIVGVVSNSGENGNIVNSSKDNIEPDQSNVNND